MNMTAFVLYLVGAAVYIIYSFSDGSIKKHYLETIDALPIAYKKAGSILFTVILFIIAIPTALLWPIWIIEAPFKVISQKFHRS